VGEVAAFVGLGVHHIMDPGGLDHVLFLLALAAIYRGRDWREAVVVVTAFTVGHSASLVLAATGALRMPSGLIELLIPLTIIATAAENLAIPERGRTPIRRRFRPLLAGVFGLVHGAGFANYLASLFSGSILAPLVGFNLGIELGQLAILAAAAVALAAVDSLLGHRVRVVAVSASVAVAAAPIALERVPW
jgi:hypothetical protein